MEIDPENRVLDETNTRTVKVTARIFTLDNSWNPDTHFLGTKLVVNNPVSVLDDSSNAIGSADVYQKGNAVFADLFLDYNTPVRLDIEAGSTSIYPYPLGSIEATVEGDVEKAALLSVRHILLDAGPAPLDSSIKPLEIIPSE